MELLHKQTRVHHSTTSCRNVMVEVMDETLKIVDMYKTRSKDVLFVLVLYRKKRIVTTTSTVRKRICIPMIRLACERVTQNSSRLAYGTRACLVVRTA